MDFKAIQALTANDMAKVNETIHAQLNSDVSLINQLGFYIISGGGKRLRPLLAVLSAKALGYQGSHHTTAAAFIEFIHTATCCTMMWSMNQTCAAVKQPPMPRLVMPPAY